MTQKIAGMIVAGGQATRMGGGDKCLLPLGGQPILSQVITQLSPQVEAIALNANGNPERFAAFGLDVVPDSAPDQPGPLAGVLAALDWAASKGVARVATVAADTPFFPQDLVARLAAVDAPVVLAASTTGRHPVFALWSVALRHDLRAALAGGQRRVNAFARDHDAVEVLFQSSDGPDPFFNINTPDDLKQAQEWAAK